MYVNVLRLYADGCRWITKAFISNYNTYTHRWLVTTLLDLMGKETSETSLTLHKPKMYIFNLNPVTFVSQAINKLDSIA